MWSLKINQVKFKGGKNKDIKKEKNMEYNSKQETRIYNKEIGSNEIITWFVFTGSLVLSV